jgi:hypothetical protein
MSEGEDTPIRGPNLGQRWVCADTRGPCTRPPLVHLSSTRIDTSSPTRCVRPRQCVPSPRVRACALWAPRPQRPPSMPAAASTPTWCADWAAARRHSWRPLDARPLAPLKGGHNGAAATTASIATATTAATATTTQPWGSGRRAGTTTRPAGLGAGIRHLDASLHRTAPGRPRRSHRASVIAGTFR